MFWNLGLSSSNTLEALLNRLNPSANSPNTSSSASPTSHDDVMSDSQKNGDTGAGNNGGGQGVTVEELLDEPDLLSELKGQNARLIQLLSSPDSIRSLLHWAAYGMEDINLRQDEREATAKAELVMLREKAQGRMLERSDAENQGSEIETVSIGLEEEKEKGEQVVQDDKMAMDSESPNDIAATPRSESGSEISESSSTSKNDIFNTIAGTDDLVPPPSYIPRPSTPNSFIQPRDTELERKRNYRYPQIATEILCSDVWSITDALFNEMDGIIAEFWEDIYGPLQQEKATYKTEVGEGFTQTPEGSDKEEELREKAAISFLVERAHANDAILEEDEKRRELLLGNWARVMGLLIIKRPKDAVEFIKSVPGAVERMVERLDSPAVQDVILRLVASEEQGVAGVIEWLSSSNLIPLLLDRLAPWYPSTTHGTISEICKAVISLCAPATFSPPSGDLASQAAQQVLTSPVGGDTTPGFGASPPEGLNTEGVSENPQLGQQQRPPAPRDNKLVRELVAKPAADLLTGYLLGDFELADARILNPTEAGNLDSEPFTYHYDPYDIQPLPSAESKTSSLIHSAIIVIELIRKNNPDFSEPSLFHTMRNRLMIMQQKQSEDRAQARIAAASDGKEGATFDGAADDEKDHEIWEAAVRQMSIDMGIVHLGVLLGVLTEKIADFQEIIQHPKSQASLRTPNLASPLTHERFRIVEMFAEILHCSNMALLNRREGSGPTYSPDGCLQGGLRGLEELGRALEGDDGIGQAEGKEGLEDLDEVQPAKELPVSVCGSSADRSVPTSEDEDEDGDDDEDAEDVPTPLLKSVEIGQAIEDNADNAVGGNTPLPPPPSQADVARLRDVMIQDPRIRNLAKDDQGIQSDAASMSNLAAASAVSVVGSEVPAAPAEDVGTVVYPDFEPEVSVGERLKQVYISERVLPSIVNLMFEYPNNNFLHNVAYDVIQQILNGRLGPGLNQELAIVLFREAKLIERLLDAQRLSERLLLEKKTSRPAIMGHLMLVAEEICKFFARCPADLFAVIEDSFVWSEWEAFVSGSMADTKTKDAILLGGLRPQEGQHPNDDGGKTDTDSSDEDDEDRELGAYAGRPLARLPSNGDAAFNSKFGFGSAESGDASNQSNSSDSDSNSSGSPQLRPTRFVPNRMSNSNSNGMDDLEDVFSPAGGNAQHIDDDDEAWGEFSAAAGAVDAEGGEDPFGDPFEPSQGGSGSGSTFGGGGFGSSFGGDVGVGGGGSKHPFTSIDFAERAFASDGQDGWGGDASLAFDSEEDSPGIEVPAGEGDSMENAAAFLAANWSVPGSSAGLDGSDYEDSDEEQEGQGEKMPPAVPARTVPLGITIPQTNPGAGLSPRGASTATSSLGTSPPTPSRLNTSTITRSRSSSFSSDPSSPDKKLHPAAALSASSPRNSAISPPDPSLINASTREEPLGHGVAPETQMTDDGMLVREIEGELVTAPADEVAMSVNHARRSSRG